jgi:hypothetical protein
MRETAEQYTKRITGYVRGKNHLNVLRSTPGKIASIVRGRRKSTLAKRPEPAKWSIAEILAHLAESEIVFAYRLRMVLSEIGTRIQSFDEQRWQENAVWLKSNPRIAVALFQAAREANIGLLTSLSRKQWSYYGIHSERGRESIARMVELYAGHDVNHLQQLKHAIREGYGP